MRNAFIVGLALALLALPFSARADTKLEIYGNADVSIDGVDRGVKQNVKNQSLAGTCTTNNATYGCSPSQGSGTLTNNGSNISTNT